MGIMMRACGVPERACKLSCAVQILLFGGWVEKPVPLCCNVTTCRLSPACSLSLRSACAEAAARQRLSQAAAAAFKAWVLLTWDPA